jgi:hypothetical protein
MLLFFTKDSKGLEIHFGNDENLFKLKKISPDYPSCVPEVTINNSLSKSSSQTIIRPNCWNLQKYWTFKRHEMS